MQYHDIIPYIEGFETVDELYDTFKKCKTDNVYLYIIKLKDGCSVFDFRNELDSYDKTQDYIILTDVVGSNDKQFIGLVDGVADLTTYCYKYMDFDPKTSFEDIAEDCRNIVKQMKDEYVAINYNDWINYQPEGIEITAENPL